MNIYSCTALFLHNLSFFCGFAFRFDTAHSFLAAAMWRPIIFSLRDASLSFCRALVAEHVALACFLFRWGPHCSYLCQRFLHGDCSGVHCFFSMVVATIPIFLSRVLSILLLCGLSLLGTSLLACCLSFFLLVPTMGNLSHW